MRKIKRGEYWPLNKEVLKQMYLKEFKTLDKIAKYFGVSKTKVWYYFKKYSIRIIEQWERYGLRKFTEKQEKYLLGSLLGDDTLSVHHSKYPFLAVTHTINQREYVNWKYELWKQIVPGDIKRGMPIKLNGKTYFADRFTTTGHPEFIKFLELFYPNGKKIVTRKILNKLTPFSIAIWYMDDGCYNSLKKRAMLATNSFTYEENLLIQKYFREVWNISSHIGTCSTGTNYIWLNTENTIKFFEMIKNYILPCFDYKINKSLIKKTLFRRNSVYYGKLQHYISTTNCKKVK